MPYRFRLLLVSFCILVSTGVSTYGAYLLRDVTNDYILPLRAEYVASGTMPALDGLFRMLALMLLMYLTGAFSTLLYNRLMMMVSTSVLNRVRKEMFDHMEDLPISYFDRHTHGEIMSRYTNDTDTLREFFSCHLPPGRFLLPVGGLFAVLHAAAERVAHAGAAGAHAPDDDRHQIHRQALGREFRGPAKGRGRFERLYRGEPSRASGWCRCSAMRSKRKRISRPATRPSASAGTRANTFAGILGPHHEQPEPLLLCDYHAAGRGADRERPLRRGQLLIAFLPMIRQLSQPISNLAQQFNTVMQALAGAERVFEADG